MTDLDRHPSLASLLGEAFDRYADDLCLIEADRDRERARLTYREVGAAALMLAGELAQQKSKRVAILMTNQSKWHVAAAAAFRVGATVVPLDPKLMPEEHEALLRHAGADTLVVEHHLWRKLSFGGCAIVTEAPMGFELRGARRFEECAGPEPAPAPRGRSDPACIVYSSGTGGRPKGCILTHGNYLSQLKALLGKYSFERGDRYLSILPTNHAIDFMCGFLGPYACGATVVHLRTLRPEFVRDAFPRYRIAYAALVPLILRNLQTGLEERFQGLRGPRRPLFSMLRWLNRLVTRNRPRLGLSRLLLKPVHGGFGGAMKAFFVGGAFTDPRMLRFFYDLGIQVANGYGLTEAGTVVTLNDFDDYRPETVGRPLPGTEVRIADADPDGIGEVLVRGPTVMAGYLDDPELTAATIVDGWLRTGDLGRLQPGGHLQLFGRRKNMIVTAGGKNVYPEDIENVFDGLPVREYCVFAAHVLWRDRGEKLVVVVRPDGREFLGELGARNRRLPDFKRVAGYVAWGRDFPRTASLKIRRDALAEEIRCAKGATVVDL
jgi:long-chain acyl-CoA synthetase